MHSHATGRHASLPDGRSAKAQVYPEALCDAICQVIKEQSGYARKDQFALAELKIADPASGIQERQQIQCKFANGEWGSGTTPRSSVQPTATEEHEEELRHVWDDVPAEK